MKSSHNIISKLKSLPEFRRLQEIDEVGKLINAFPLDMRKYISFGVQKGKKLCFALNNPLLCTEYNRYKSALIMEILQSCKERFVGLQEVQEVWFYYPKDLQKNQEDKYFNSPKHTASMMEQTEVYYLQSYKEHSNGEFENLADNPKIHEVLEKIRQTILKNLNDA